MMDQIAVRGMVLSVMPVGDYDRRIVLLTKERGKISAFAKGARKPNSPFLACSQPFVFGTFTLYEGRTSYTLQRAEVDQYFQELRGNMERTFYGMYFCEVAEYLTGEGNDEQQMLKLLYLALRGLYHETIGPKLARLIFEWKAMYLNGEGPEVSHCVRCRSPFARGVFRVRSGGYVCEACEADGLRKIPGDIVRSLSAGAWYTLQFLAATPPEKLFTFNLTEEVMEELSELFSQYREEYWKHRFTSLDMLNIL